MGMNSEPLWPWPYFWAVWRMCATHGNMGKHDHTDHLDLYAYGDDGARMIAPEGE